MISIKDVEHVANLAKLSLNSEEKQLYTEQLGKILAYFASLQEVDTNGVEPLAQALPIVSVMRNDEAKVSPGHELFLKNAPDQENGYFRVPKIGE